MTRTRRYDSLLAELQHKPRRSSSFLVAVDGCAGSGKTTFARKLQELDPAVGVIHLDDFYLPSAQRPDGAPTIAEEYDIARLVADVLTPLTQNQPAHFQSYDWGEDRLAEYHTIPAGGMVVIEGVSTLLPQLTPIYDYRIWVECPYDLRLVRGLARDGEQVRDWWVNGWMPAEQRYIQVYSPVKRADLKVDGSVEVPNEFAVLSM
jgi:uridine kinase